MPKLAEFSKTLWCYHGWAQHGADFLDPIPTPNPAEKGRREGRPSFTTTKLPAIILSLTAAAALTAVSAATAAAIFLWTRFVYVQRPPVQLRSIESVDGAIAFGIATHFHKAEASWLARIAVGYDADTVNGPICLEQRAKSIFGRWEA